MFPQTQLGFWGENFWRHCNSKLRLWDRGVRWGKMKVRFKNSNTKNIPEEENIFKKHATFSLYKNNSIHPTPQF